MTTTITKYALLYTPDSGKVSDPGNVDNYIIYPTEQEAEAEAGIRTVYPGPVVKITIETPDPPLPTAVGSVVRATTADGTGLYALTDEVGTQGDWVGLDGWMAVSLYHELTDVKVLFDAATVKED